MAWNLAGEADGAGAAVVVDEVGADAAVDARAGAALVDVRVTVGAGKTWKIYKMSLLQVFQSLALKNILKLFQNL